MTGEIVERVLRSRRYRDVDPALVGRLATEELARARSTDDAVKRVKRRLHQAVGAFRGETPTDALERVRVAWNGTLESPDLRDACRELLATHASTRERLDDLERFHAGIWERTGVPDRLLDLGCGLGPVALPWMRLPATSHLHVVDADRRPLDTVAAFLRLVGQPHLAEARDVVADPPDDPADVALLLKLVTTLDRQDPAAATRLIEALPVRHAVVSFTARSLGGRGRGMERTYRDRADRLAASVARCRSMVEASVPSELVFVLELEPLRG
jgi:16S rRNA (guanine(1405)-N(7))-methyltransferase